jgi:hypothetical protein
MLKTLLYKYFGWVVVILGLSIGAYFAPTVYRSELGAMAAKGLWVLVCVLGIWLAWVISVDLKGGPDAK